MESSILLYKRRGTLISSGLRPEVAKVPWCTHRHRLTSAMASANEGLVLSYHAVERAVSLPSCPISTSAASVTTLNSPNSAGVVRAIALSDHCRCVSHPHMSAKLLEGHFNLPAKLVPLQYPQRFGLSVGA